jgi:hypothetical protein
VIKVRVAKPALEEFKASEFGSYEDADCPDTGHVWCILDRHSAAIEIRNNDEAAEVYYALVTGTFALRDKGYLRTARRIANAVRDAARRADPALVEQYPEPDGY